MSGVNTPIAVIGSGHGGLPAACVLAEAGFSVVVLDRGTAYHTKNSHTDAYNFEKSPLPWEKGESEWSGPVEYQRAIGLGGSSLYFQGVSQLPPKNVTASWGLDSVEFERASQNVISFLKVTPGEQAAHPLNPVSSRLFEAGRKMGWDIARAPVAILSEPSAGRPACNYCGQCVFGCKPRDKGSVDNTWIPRLKKTGRAEIISSAYVKNILLSERDTVGAIEYEQKGQMHRIDVAACVLAAGPLETPFLLRKSKQALAPNGLGNASVGRYLTGSLLHSHIISLPDGHKGYAGVPIDLIVNEFEREGVVLCQGRNLAGITGPVSLAKFYASNFGAAGIKKWMKQHYEKVAVLAGFVEVESKYKNGIDMHGKKRFSVDTSSLENKLRLLQEKLFVWNKAAGGEELSSPNVSSALLSGAMLRGACRLGGDEETSALTDELLLRGYKNILVTDSSALPSGVVAHPSLPVQVLSYYAGQRFARRLGT